MNTLGKIAAWLVCVLVFGIVLFFSGYYYGSKTVEPGVVYRDKIVQKTIYRDYPKLTRSTCIDKLTCYDTAPPSLDITYLEENDFRISAGLCEREWSRDVKIEAARSGAWRFYIAGGFAAGIAAAYFLLNR
jgi:hypothetical protein